MLLEGKASNISNTNPLNFPEIQTATETHFKRFLACPFYFWDLFWITTVLYDGQAHVIQSCKGPIMSTCEILIFDSWQRNKPTFYGIIFVLDCVFYGGIENSHPSVSLKT